MEEAEAATAQLDAAFAATGRTLGLTRGRLDGLATSIQQTTKFSDDLVKEGESILLTFDKVRGLAFERTIKVATDLSSRLGTDLTQSIRQVGLALQDPIAGLTALRRSGVAPLTESQQNLVKVLLETNQLGKAQALILSELERRYKGSAAAARGTLGGALAGLKNSFGDLFEGSRESSKAAADAINQLTEALNDPDVKSGLDALIEGSAKIAANFIKAASEQAKIFKQGFGLGDLANQFNRGGGPRRGGPRNRTPETESAVVQLEEIRVSVRKLVDENGDLMREFREQTRTATQSAAAEYTKLKTTLQFLRDQGVEAGGISQEEFGKRLGGSLDDILPEFDLNEIRARYITLKKETSELGEFMKGVWQGVGQSIQSTLSDAIYEWKLSWKSLIDIARRALADIASAIITSGIQKALKQAFASSSTSSSPYLAAFNSIFGLAGGGGFDGLRMVGEDGPELVGGRGQVWNKRQMAFAGAGAKIVYAPVNNFSIIEREDPQKAKAELLQYVETRTAQQQSEFVRVLGRSGIEVRG